MADTTAAAPPDIFDRALLRTRLDRAGRAGPVTFLLDRAVEDLADRLDVTTRAFEHALDLWTPGPAATRMLRARGVARVTTAAMGDIADGGKFPYPSESFDLVVSALALQHVNDLPGALAQIRRALRPDGLFLGCLVGGQSLRELRAAMTEAELDLTGGASPRVSPFVDLRDMGALMQRAGFALPVADVDTLTLRHDSLFALARDLRGMGCANALRARDRRPLARSVLARAADVFARDNADPDGRARSTIEIIHVSGWAPHASQQQPLKPGSARTRLADALGTRERKPGP